MLLVDQLIFFILNPLGWDEIVASTIRFFGLNLTFSMAVATVCKVIVIRVTLLHNHATDRETFFVFRISRVKSIVKDWLSV